MQKMRFLLLICLTIFWSRIQAQSTRLISWTEDEVGLPCIEYKGKLPYEHLDNLKNKMPFPEDPWFILGNNRLTCFQHASGVYQLINCERAWGKSNNADQYLYGETSSELTVGDKSYNLIGLKSLAADTNTQKVFGCGFARFFYKPEKDITIVRTVDILPSLDAKNAIPALLITLRIKNKSSVPKKIIFSEAVMSRYKMLGESEDKDLTYLNHVFKDESTQIVKCEVTYTSEDPIMIEAKNIPSRYDGFPQVLYMKALDVTSNDLKVLLNNKRINNHQDLISVSYETWLMPRENKVLRIIVGLSSDASFSSIQEDCSRLTDSAKLSEPQKNPCLGSESFFRKQWKTKLPSFENENDYRLKQELKYHAYVLESMAKYKSYYNESFVPQGTNYDYEWGNSGSVRDHLQHALALCYIDPELAKSAIRLCLQKVEMQGGIRYTEIGNSVATNLLWNTSDQQLYLYYTIAEYLRITKDYSFLLEKTPYYPLESKMEATVLEKLQRTFIYFRDLVSIGPHGLTKILNSDWNDQIFHVYPVNGFYWSSESHLNSAMSLAVLYKLIQQLENSLLLEDFSKHKTYIQNLCSSMRIYRQKQKVAFMNDLGDRNFVRRAYLGDSIILGDKDIYLEPQAYTLLIPDFPNDKKKLIFSQVENRLIHAEKIGARQMEIPVNNKEYKSGQRENAGFWYSLNGALIAGVNTFDKTKAKELLMKMTLANQEKNFPDYWPGLWSSGDCINSSLAKDLEGAPGDGVWYNFPVFCAHIHAWILYNYFLINER